MSTYELKTDESLIITARPHFMILFWHIILTLISMFLWLPILIFKIISVSKTNYILTNKRVIFESGVFSKTSKESPLNKVQNVSHYQPLFGRMLNYGHVSLQTASEMGMTVFRHVPDPKGYKAQIVDQTELFNDKELEKKAMVLKNAVSSSQEDPGASSADDRKDCPQCAEQVKKAAKICRYCNYEFAVN